LRALLLLYLTLHPHILRWPHAHTQCCYTHATCARTKSLHTQIATLAHTCLLAPSLTFIPLFQHKPGLAPQPFHMSRIHSHTILSTPTLRCLFAFQALSTYLVGPNYFPDTPTAYSSIHCFTSSNMALASVIVDPASPLSAQTLPPPLPTPQPCHSTSPESELISASCRYLLQLPSQPHTSSAPHSVLSPREVGVGDAFTTSLTLEEAQSTITSRQSGPHSSMQQSIKPLPL
jgi:hypothetical protein